MKASKQPLDQSESTSTPDPQPVTPRKEPSKGPVFISDVLKEDPIYAALRQVSTSVNRVVQDYIATVAEREGIPGYSYATEQPPPPPPK
jgi:hypothetical protein